MSWSGRKVTKLKRLVAETYGLTCHLCREPIDTALRFPHIMSLTVDHLVPRGRAGSDALENLRPAHLTCNSSRQDKALRVTRVADQRDWFAP